jgi:DnaK suppressor protein
MLNKTFLKKVSEKLVNERKNLLSKTQIDQDIESIDLDGDETDEIQGAMLIEMQNRIATRHAEKIARIDNAILRIKELTYGICEDCTENIPEKRLEANPYFLTCISCAEDRELQEKHKRS